MTRTKVKLAYITNDSARKATFKKRKKGLIKKVSELSTLCDVDACAIICSPYNAQPEVYPSSSGVQRVLAKFKKMPEMEQSKKMVNQESFLRQKIAKANEQLKKQRKENKEKEITHVMFQSLTGAKGLQGLSVQDLKDLGWMIEQKLKDINKRMERIGDSRLLSTQGGCKARVVAVQAATITAEEKPRSCNGESATLVATGAVERPPEFETNGDSNMQRQLQWFMDMINVPQQHQHVGFGREDVLSFGESGHWPNGFFP
ncbi:Agamous-like MADS-box protein AGL80 [Morus notabilis]|uniref:Agamous-like MADS-box protein AGL80 n=1 Tax=Morus notabilis TaxID=981085 RepID=W9RTN9_9ROSA|nr:agamous-like MADS-box protein AGL80 [Morus notabilis]EXB70639.1 Agamous-like MADS-box protein AGL80 [Morus notabilis]